MAKGKEKGTALPTDNKEIAKRLEAADKEYNDLNAELKTKKYAVKADEKFVKELNTFLNDKAKFTGREALGIVESIKELKGTKVKNEAIMVSGLAIQAINYFLDKFEGTGYEAETFLSIYKPINNAVGAVNQDNQKLQNLEMKRNALEQGLELEVTEEKA